MCGLQFIHFHNVLTTIVSFVFVHTAILTFITVGMEIPVNYLPHTFMQINSRPGCGGDICKGQYEEDYFFHFSWRETNVLSLTNCMLLWNLSILQRLKTIL